MKDIHRVKRYQPCSLVQIKVTELRVKKAMVKEIVTNIMESVKKENKISKTGKFTFLDYI